MYIFKQYLLIYNRPFARLPVLRCDFHMHIFEACVHHRLEWVPNPLICGFSWPRIMTFIMVSCHAQRKQNEYGSSKPRSFHSLGVTTQSCQQVQGSDYCRPHVVGTQCLPNGRGHFTKNISHPNLRYPNVFYRFLIRAMWLVYESVEIKTA